MVNRRTQNTFIFRFTNSFTMDSSNREQRCWTLIRWSSVVNFTRADIAWTSYLNMWQRCSFKNTARGVDLRATCGLLRRCWSCGKEEKTVHKDQEQRLPWVSGPVILDPERTVRHIASERNADVGRRNFHYDRRPGNQKTFPFSWKINRPQWLWNNIHRY